MKAMSNIQKKVQDKSPLKYSTIRRMVCLEIYCDPDWCQVRMSSLVHKFLLDKQLSGDVFAGSNSLIE